MKPFIDPAFWSDPDIEKQPAGVKLSALWLITNSQTSLLGVCGASVSRYTFETGLPSQALTRTLQALAKSLTKIGDVIFIRNYVRHQFGAGEQLQKNNFFKPLSSLFVSIKDDKLRAEILKEYPEFQKPFVRASQGLAKPKEGKGKEREERKSAEKESRRPINPMALRIATIFGRQPETAWSEKEIKSFRNQAMTEEHVSLVERYYGSERKKRDNICRRDLQTLLNNWPGEVDRARTWCQMHPLPGARKVSASRKEIEFVPPPNDPEAEMKFCEEFERLRGRLPYGYARNGDGGIHKVAAST
jgi:hypothetical protein